MNLCKDADVVYSYNGTISLLLSRICQAGVPTVTKVPGLTLSNMFAYLRLPLNAVNPLELFAHFGLQPVYSYLTWLDLRNSTKLVFDSDLSLRRAESFYKIPVRAKSVVISNLAGEFLLRTPRREPKKQVIFVGRLIALKGILDLLEAFSLVVGNSEFADWKLVVLGDGPLRAKVSRRIQELNLKENVTLMGWVDSTEVRKYAAESYLLVHPSYTESDSVTVAEAMALGLPIVVPSEPWASDQTRDYPLRFFFKLGDTHGLARAIENAIRLQLRRVPWARANSQGDALWAVLQQAAHNSLYLPPKPAEHG
jgi:glycosyltransferase involved in cell wall biosynthesis